MQVRTYVTVLLLAVFILAAVFGLYLPMMGHAGHEMGCPFMGMTAICEMSPLQHIAAWQNMFASIPAQKDVLAILLLLLLALASLKAVRMWQALSPPNTISLLPRRRSDQTYISPHTYLQEAFSSGILNPKLF